MNKICLFGEFEDERHYSEEGNNVKEMQINQNPVLVAKYENICVLALPLQIQIHVHMKRIREIRRKDKT